MLPDSLIPDVLPIPSRRIAEEEPLPPTPPLTPIASLEQTTDASDDTEAAEMQQRLTLRELKEMCGERSLSCAGKKGELVARILAHDRSNPPSE